MRRVKVFVSFDFDNDQDLKHLFCGQADHPDTPFEIADVSVKQALLGDWKAKAEAKIRSAEQVVVLCGEKTHTATGVTDELRIAQALRKPYFLLWGRNGKACTRPDGAPTTDKIYTWKWELVGRLLRGER